MRTQAKRWLRLFVLSMAAHGLASGGERSGAAPVVLPGIIMDDSAANWKVDRFAGNSTSGSVFFQGPANQVGGLTYPYVAPAPDGRVFMAEPDRLMMVKPDGQLVLLAGGGANRSDCAASEAMIMAESIAYSPAEDALYFCHRTVPCVRRLVRRDGQWRVEVVAGSPSEHGTKDGPVRDARFLGPRGLAANSRGEIILLEGAAQPRRLCRIAGGQVKTLTNFPGKELSDGPLEKAGLAVTQMSGQICMGDDDDTLYIADHWNFAVRKVDLKTMTISTVVWQDRGRKDAPFNRPGGGEAGNDGPALTHVSMCSGMAFVAWDPVRKTL